MEADGNGGSRQTPPPVAPLRKGPWTPEEDAILIEHVRVNGKGNWNSVQKVSSLSRCGKSCRLRWANHLRPDLKKGQLTPEEQLTVLRLHAQIGNKWARMASHLPGRTDNEIKNYWNTKVKRRQRAGLPLYSPGLFQRNPPPRIAIPSSAPPSPLFHYSPPQTSPMMFNSAGRARDDVGVDFSFPLSTSPAQMVMPRTWHTAPSTPAGDAVLNYGMVQSMSMSMPSLLLPGAMQPGYSSGRGMEGQVLDGGGGVNLSDQEALDSVVDWAELDGNSGPISTMQETNPTSTHCNIPVPDFYEMTVPAQPMWTPSSDWTNCDNNNMSNGGPTDEEHRSLLASSPSVAPLEPEWNMPSCHWSTMPELV